MVRGPSRCMLLFVLVAWILLGPIGMSFGSCAAMMALCDGGPCGVVTALASTTPTVAAPVPVSEVPAAFVQHMINVLRSALEPPPKSVRPSA